MSPKSIQRAYRKEEITVQWLGRMARFDLAKVQRAMARNGRSRMRRLNGGSTQRQMARGEGLARLEAGLSGLSHFFRPSYQINQRN
jgi:hypothetical protein